MPQCPESSLGISAILSHFLLFIQSHPFLRARTVISWVRVSACFLLRVSFHAPLGDWAPQTAADTGLLLPSETEFCFGLFLMVGVLMLSFSLISNFFPFAFRPLIDSASLLLPLGVIKERSGQEEAVCRCL